ncbi:MAG: SRPBCC domain-containing protein [Thermoplasmata archaeon]|nr:SRPBCC domain-containing protein [Thermoplasmata archaeon]MCI4340766.1 SRPBCC domain-containing protein [Thermoplasmata archaeon]
MSSSKNLAVDRQFFIRASPSTVFDAISTPRGLASWMVVRAELPAQTGAKYEFEFDGGWRHEGTVQRFRAGRSITLTWAWEGVPVKGTVLTLSVRPKKGGALFRFVHSGFPREKKWMDLYGVTEWGWTYYGMNLKSVLEAHHDLRSRWDG